MELSIDTALGLESLAWIEANPEKHDQQIWLDQCGSTGCWAGWMAAFDPAVKGARMASDDEEFYAKSTEVMLVDGTRMTWNEYVRARMGWTTTEANRAVDGMNTLDDLRSIVRGQVAAHEGDEDADR
jgi:hypothetical protein